MVGHHIKWLKSEKINDNNEKLDAYISFPNWFENVDHKQLSGTSTPKERIFVQANKGEPNLIYKEDDQWNRKMLKLVTPIIK